ncbi:hypothetical protein B296_00037925 [Ensete ventricosum]|uniref:Uncharacterized protein n=1 Tax=Ensete ventricosum TaxID=4639 RepID=A0A426XWL9_ENSVE|nr:hypothetical protein B296_00037925 [Ensete ventricosum]
MLWAKNKELRSGAGLEAVGTVAKRATELSNEGGFQSGLEKMGQITYEFRYQITLKHFRAKHSNLSIKEGPFAD